MANKGLLLVTMEPPASLEEEFNDWYDGEHFPQRCALPGFESGTRWVCLEGWPRWLALYDLVSTDALETAAYRAVSGANSTPWSRRILSRVTGRRRVVAEQVGSRQAVLASTEGIARLLLARVPGNVPAAELERRCSALEGISQARIFRGGEGELWAICAFDRPVTLAALATAGSGADLFNLYAPYHRG